MQIKIVMSINIDQLVEDEIKEGHSLKEAIQISKDIIRRDLDSEIITINSIEEKL